MKLKDEIKELRGCTPKQISAKITDSRAKLVRLNQDKILGKLKNVHEITVVKKSISRMQTILDEKIREDINA